MSVSDYDSFSALQPVSPTSGLVCKEDLYATATEELSPSGHQRSPWVSHELTLTSLAYPMNYAFVFPEKLTTLIPQDCEIVGQIMLRLSDICGI